MIYKKLASRNISPSKSGLLEKKVFWRKGPACKQEELPGLDPEQFQPISDAVAQYQDSLYTIIETESGDRKLEIVKLDDPNLIINKRFNAGKRHGYLLTRAEGWPYRPDIPFCNLRHSHIPNVVPSRLSELVSDQRCGIARAARHQSCKCSGYRGHTI